MPEGFEIIRARVKDDAPILIDRLLKSKQGEVVLVLPKNSIIAANLDSLKILQQEAESVGKILSLNTENDDIKNFAETLRMPIYDAKKSKHIPIEMAPDTEPMRKSVKKLMDIMPPSYSRNRHFEEPPVSEAPEAPEMQSETPIYEVKSENLDFNGEVEKNIENFYGGANKDNSSVIKPKRYFSYNRAIMAIIILGGISFTAAMYLVLPEANIKISINKMPLKASIPVAVSKNINSSNLASGIIPGQYFSLNKSGSKIFTVEGENKEVISKASGYIEIYNAYGAASQKLVAQTRFETKEGKIFRIQNSIIVPGAKMISGSLTPSSIRAKVVADSAGEEYNIGSSYFTIPRFKGSSTNPGFYAKSTEPMAAGKIEVGKTLTNELLENAKNKLRDQLAEELESDALSAVKDSDLKLIDGASSVKINEFKSSIPIGTDTDSFTVTMEIAWQALVFKEKDFMALIDNFIASKYPNAGNFSFSATGGNNQIQYPKANSTDFKKGELFFTFNIDKENILAVNTADLQKELSGRGENDIRTLIADKKFINEATISFWPFWVNRAPANPKKVNIMVDNN